MTPRLRVSSSSESSLFSAPRSLKEAVNWRFSNFRKISVPVSADSVSEANAGVTSTAPSMVFAAASMSANVTGKSCFGAMGRTWLFSRANASSALRDWIGGRARVRRQGDELFVVAVGQLEAAGTPIRLRLLESFLRRRDEVPINEALAHGLAAKEHHHRRRERGEQHRGARRKHQHVACLERPAVDLDGTRDDVGRALGI